MGIREYIGNQDQIITVQESRLVGGRAEGVRKIDVDLPCGLSAVVLPDRNMDLYQIRFKGKNLNYIGPQGIVHPAYYDERGLEWLYSFFVGFLTTIGLQHTGGPVEVNGEQRGLHGRISSTPADDVRVTRKCVGGEAAVTVEGTMREARIFGPNLSLHRAITFVETGKMIFEDTVTNNGCGDWPFLLGYHINYGYPLLSPATRFEIEADPEKIAPRTENAAETVDTWNVIEEPDYPYPERCYAHAMLADEDGKTGYRIWNEKEKVSVRVRYEKDALPYLTEWKMLGKGEYVLGLEPMNAPLDGAKIGEEGCLAPVLAPGESKTYTLEFTFEEV